MRLNWRKLRETLILKRSYWGRRYRGYRRTRRASRSWEMRTWLCLRRFRLWMLRLTCLWRRTILWRKASLRLSLRLRRIGSLCLSCSSKSRLRVAVVRWSITFKSFQRVLMLRVWERSSERLFEAIKLKTSVSRMSWCKPVLKDLTLTWSRQSLIQRLNKL